MACHLNGFDGFVHRRMRDWGVPGLVVGIVKGPQTLYTRGFGLRDVGRRLPVTQGTRFCINSLTKAFTATAIGMLVDEGKLQWDEPVRTYIPSFEMQDQVATERTTVRDLLVHRTGLPPHYCALFTSLSSRRGILERLPHFQLFRDFREAACYTNITYAVLGALVAHVTSLTWEQFVRTRMFEPLGMKNSTFATEDLSQLKDFAVGYRRESERLRPWLKEHPFPLPAFYAPKAPAAAIISSVTDLCRWLRFQINGTTDEGHAILSPEALSEIHTAHATGYTVRNPALGDVAYALGWLVQPYRGYRCLLHTGSGRGYRAVASFLPHESLGVVVLTNAGSGWLPQIIQFNAYDRLLELAPIPWHRQYQRMVEREAARDKQQRRRRPRHCVGPFRALSEYAGTYHDPGYGMLEVSATAQRLRVHYNGLVFRARRCEQDIFELSGRHEDPVQLRATFRANQSGAIASVAIPFEPSIKPIVFRRSDEGVRS